MGEIKQLIYILVDTNEGKRSLRSPKHRWLDNTKINLKEIGHEDEVWIHVTLGTNGGLF
jgi:hypothetical protein